MRRILTPLAALFLSLGMIGCQVGSTTEGSATFAKPASEGGEPVPRQESSEDLQLTINIAGSGIWDVLQGSACTLLTGDASGSVQASGEIRANGNYVSGFATAEGQFSSPLNILCDELQNVQFEAVASFTVTASIPANQQNCDGFCQAQAEVECEGSADGASCIATAAAECQTQCEGSQRITGSGSIAADALVNLNDELGASGDIKADVELVFDSLE